jgi:predicted nucleic acid-binding protein
MSAASWGYFDTSVLAKRYIREEGSPKARLLLRRHRFLSSAIAPLELVSALTRRHLAGELSDKGYGAILQRLKNDREYWELIEVGPEVLGRAEELIRQTGLRTLDALHLASCLMFQSISGMSIPLITADTHQQDAARSLSVQLLSV